MPSLLASIARPVVCTCCLLGLPSPLRQKLHSEFHSLLHRCHERASLQVVPQEQRRRRFAHHIYNTVGEDHGERVRSVHLNLHTTKCCGMCPSLLFFYCTSQYAVTSPCPGGEDIFSRQEMIYLEAANFILDDDMVSSCHASAVEGKSTSHDKLDNDTLFAIGTSR